jgi:hypothetical protein
MEIKDYPCYLIYEDGRVWSKKTKIFLKTTLDKNGYRHLSLCNNDKIKTFKVHRLVGLHYIPNPNNYKEIDHIDRNILNNNKNNLRWANRSINSINRSMCKNNKLGIKNISKCKNVNLYEICIARNNLRYRSFKKTLEEAIVQRDLMLSMFI